MTPSTSRTATDSPAARFLEELGRRGHDPRLRGVTGRVRFELVDGKRTEPWLVTVDRGDLTVAREAPAAAADCTIRGERALFDEIVAGRANAAAAVLRGALACHGDLELLFAIQRIFPDPPRGWDPTADTRSA